MPSPITRVRGARASRTRGWLVLGTPAVIVYFTVVMIPILVSFFFSLTNLNLRFPTTDFVGFDNYVRLVSDPLFWESLEHTAVITLVVLIVPNVLGLAVAMLLDRVGALYLFIRSVFFVPVTLSAVVVSFVWSTILTDRGVLNSVLRGLGLDSLAQSWLGAPGLALLSIALVMSWQMTGFCAVIYLAGLKGVPRELVEAATVDGASAVKRFRFITWPFLAPALTVNVTILLITALKTYDHVVVLTNGGPAGSTETLATSIIGLAFENTRTAYASAMAIVLLLIIATVSALALRILQAREIRT